MRGAVPCGAVLCGAPSLLTPGHWQTVSQPASQPVVAVYTGARQLARRPQWLRPDFCLGGAAPRRGGVSNAHGPPAFPSPPAKRDWPAGLFAGYPPRPPHARAPRDLVSAGWSKSGPVRIFLITSSYQFFLHARDTSPIVHRLDPSRGSKRGFTVDSSFLGTTEAFAKLRWWTGRDVVADEALQRGGQRRRTGSSNGAGESPERFRVQRTFWLLAVSTVIRR